MNWFSAGRAIGVSSSLVVLGLLGVMALAPTNAPAPRITVLVLVPTAVLAAGVLAASLVGSPVILLIAFLVSFLPIGLYLLLTPGVFRWIGIAELGYLLAAALLYCGDRSRR